MENCKNLTYQGLRILECEVSSKDEFCKINEENYDIIKLLIPSENCDIKTLEENDYTFADRTVETSISLLKCENFDKNIRLPIIETEEYKSKLVEIAQKSFPYDRRFHLKKSYDKDFADIVIQSWVEESDKNLVCLYKEMPIGFLSLKKIDEKTNFVHLAAVDEKYRMTGAAMALYSKAIQISKEKGFSSLNGRISSKNMAVMNLYSYFDAKFSEPIDIYIKEVK